MQGFPKVGSLEKYAFKSTGAMTHRRLDESQAAIIS